ncbi:MAG: bifunctional riboflavin kinase/FAD synthetase [Nitrospirae bacterium CG_4_9_14_3_um_filter_53_35]|nr:MAG: bifunctional riboflavin kinase/FAD synthetase [Nitrospirae bacterium CG08_land_8_20_14_0_20_52_24]PJA75987.1 MAG: bifunctional riboflavin kinase/FAD synthetase [Nitrospirae bacterium CG_4_9_14_3_um_filter_53_35]
MQIIRDLDRLNKTFPYPVVTLGNYDGVHLGHQQIFRKVIESARRHNGAAVIFTFEPHPLQVLSPSTCPPLLNTFRRKMELFESFGIDLVICAEFTRDFASISPEDFVKEILVEKIGVKEIFVGYDYAFGRGKQGTTEALIRMGGQYHFKALIVEAYTLNGEVVSATRIRELVQEGKMEDTARMLGRLYATEGIVVPGDHRGKSLGFPTANIEPHNQIYPKPGVYAVQVEHRGRRLNGVVNIGTHPTFGEGKTTIEVHIFDFHEEIYGQFVRILYAKRIRDEIAFKNKEELIRRIQKDIEAAEKIFKIIKTQGAHP